MGPESNLLSSIANQAFIQLDMQGSKLPVEFLLGVTIPYGQ